MGSAFYKVQCVGDIFVVGLQYKGEEKVLFDWFFDFVIGVVQCLEVFYYSLGMIYGEICGDVFYYNVDDGQVRIVFFGFGMRLFEYGLISVGWLLFFKEFGVKNKFYYISFEQMG